MGFEHWFEAFEEIGNDRIYKPDGSLGPIPARSIREFSQDWPPDDALLFRRCIRAMDEVYLNHVNGVIDIPESDNPARDAFRANMRKAPEND